MKQSKIKFILLIIIFSSLTLANSKNYIRLKVGIHFDSQVSGGRYSLDELGSIIHNSNLDVAIITDHDNMKVTYGIKPFQNFLKYSINKNSVSNFGYKKYFDTINKINSNYSNVEIIPGIEAVPYYSWQGNPFKKNLKLCNWHRHLLIFGMDNLSAYKKLPSIPQGLGYEKPNGNWAEYIGKHYIHFVLQIFFILIFCLSVLITINKLLIRHRSNVPVISILFTLGFAFILYINYPFLPKKFTQYDNSNESGPFQELINHVYKNNGIIFWAHPEVNHEEIIPVNIPMLEQNVKVTTKAYPHLISETINHSGFAVFWEGMNILGKPGGLWDFSLEEYCKGIRSRPIYTISELDFEESNNLKLLNESNTFIFSKDKSRRSIFEAIKTGRMYSTRNFIGETLFIEDFSAYDISTEQSAFIGETLKLTTKPVALHIKISQTLDSKPITVMLYRNSIKIKEFNIKENLDTWFTDENIPDTGNFYYKLYGGKNWVTLVTNPIFINQKR